MGRGGKNGGRGRGGFGRGAGPGARPDRRTERTNKADVIRHNEKYERFYNELGIVPEDQRDEFWAVFRRDLPNSFRFTGSKAHAVAVQQRLKEFYIPKITSITYEGECVEAPKPVPWYPDQLAWFMTTPKNVIRRFPPFALFQKFLVNESDVGNISRQEVVSMIPPLLMDLKPGMTVLDLCAAPGSKSAQLIEMVHAGEEERTREVAQHLANGLDRPAGDEHVDDGRSTGLLIANDVDYKRAHMLVHQMKRLSSPNIIITNHDATIFPSIKLPSESSGEGKPVPNRYLKFDRILADVPCSGDGTARKNLEIWRNWTPSNGLGLHMTQVRILTRAVQMLKPGGRVVYSTCSMNPVENEAVLAHAIELCGGPEMLYLIDTSGFLPNLKRYPGLKTWKVMDKTGRIWSSFEEVEAQRANYGDDGLGRLQREMFSPAWDLSLDRCMRIYPCQQDTGAFFIAILERKGQEVSKAKSVPAEMLPGNAHVIDEVVQRSSIAHARASGAGEVQDTEHGQAETAFPPSSKRKIDDEDKEAASSKRLRVEQSVQLDRQYTENTNGLATADVDSCNDPVEPINGHNPVDARPSGTIHDPEQTIPQSAETPVENPTTPQLKSQDQPYKTKKHGQSFEEPFKYLPPISPELAQVYAFYNISPRFPRDRFMVRNAAGTPSKNIYYTTSLAKAILQENEGKGMKFVHAGVKMFVKQDVPKPEMCPWRIQTDGMAILEAWVGPERVVKLTKKETLRKLLKEMFPRFHGDEWANLAEIGEQVLNVGMGCCVLRIEPSEDEDGLRERMVFPLWKSLHSLNLMLPKEERRALLLRLFNDETPLVNETQKKKASQQNGDAKAEKATVEGPAVRLRREWNSSSPEPDIRPGPAGADEEGPNEEEGGVSLPSADAIDEV